MNITHRARTMLASPRSHRMGVRCLALAIIVSGQADLALAAGDVFQPINSVFTTLLNFMTGTFATTAATIACAAVGYLALTSRIPWSWCFSIIVGIAFIFGGSQLVTTMSSGLGN